MDRLSPAVNGLNLDECSPEHKISDKKLAPQCSGCKEDILDKFILRVLPDQEWHVECLRCSECGQQLDETWTCFIRDNKPYCKVDYIRLYSVKCARCCCSFCENDLVMRAGPHIYHIDCFRCVVCGRRLATGDEYALRDSRLLCRDDHQASERAESPGCPRPDTRGGEEGEKETEFNNNNVDSSDQKDISRSPSTKVGSAPTSSNPRLGHGRSSGSRSHKSDQKTTRIRTVLNEKQLHTLRTCYAANPRPDALMKEQLVEMTGLNSRVIRVWFQNKRCKDKKRSMLLKQIQQQQLDKGDDCDDDLWPGMCQKGIPMIASSPMRHDPPPSSLMQMAPVEIHQYPSPWKALSDFALQSELDQTSSFRQLVRTFGESSGDEDDFQPDDDTVVSFDDPGMRLPRPGHVLGPREGMVLGPEGGKDLKLPGMGQKHMKKHGQPFPMQHQGILQHQQPPQRLPHLSSMGLPLGLYTTESPC